MSQSSRAVAIREELIAKVSELSEIRAKIRVLLEEPVNDLSRRDRENLAIMEAAINLFGGSVIW